LPAPGNGVEPRMATGTGTRQRPDQALVYAALVIVAGVLATTLAQPQVLARLPLQNLLKKPAARRPHRQRRVLFLGRPRVVPEALRRHPDRRVPGLRQPAQELHPDQCYPGGIVLAGVDRHPPRLPQAPVRRDRDQHFHGGREHRGRRLHGRNRAGQCGLGPADRDPPACPAGLPDTARCQSRGRCSLPGFAANPSVGAVRAERGSSPAPAGT
jgi:hypothetical protein